MSCIPKVNCRCTKALFSLHTEDKHNNAPLSGTVFTVQSNACPLFSVKSDKDGTVRFPPLCPGTYTIVLTRAPTGYSLREELPLLRVTAKGNLRLGGKTVRRLTLLFER
ncbi:MAG: prealbumin-like fold domain-containing protein [Oscillospiraceae bacterium]|nr:prealbumin-like fold domain-containing protein [Oscillospiraceae bacterium]